MYNSYIPEPNSGCWIWIASGQRYGKISVNNIDRKAHVVSYEIHKGPIPSNLKVLHKCDNSYCINPDHLFLGTQKDNVADMIKKGRANFQKKITLYG